MFDISWTEFVLIGVVALIVIGPKELPGVMRTLGQWTRKVRGMASEFQSQFQEAMREAEMTDLKKQVDDIARDVKNYDPLKDVRTDLEAVGKDLEDTTKFGTSAAAEPAAVPAPAEASAPPALPAVETSQQSVESQMTDAERRARYARSLGVSTETPSEAAAPAGEGAPREAAVAEADAGPRPAEGMSQQPRSDTTGA